MRIRLYLLVASLIALVSTMIQSPEESPPVWDQVGSAWTTTEELRLSVSFTPDPVFRLRRPCPLQSLGEGEVWTWQDGATKARGSGCTGVPVSNHGMLPNIGQTLDLAEAFAAAGPTMPEELRQRLRRQGFHDRFGWWKEETN